MAFTAKDVKDLRDQTNAGMMDCKKALTETDGNIEDAVKWLREKGMASAAKRVGRAASQGAVTSYIHMGGKIGVLAEINCETDFVARCDEFQSFCKDVCLQVCSAAPRWVRIEDVPASDIASEKEIYMARARETGKPEKILDKIADGMLNKWFAEVCLIEQPFVKDPEKTIETLRKELSGKLGENIVIRRFSRFVLGECSAAPAEEGE
ncbi:MAG: elongation factor Ts [Candidatus Hydrogenedentes bacterium]|nr:elongation factor Ts [Candidatus Hydrogenedentota bacterium]